MPAAKKPKLPSSADKVDAYYTHTETEGTSLEDIAIDLLRSESASAPLAQLLDPAHGLNLLESVCIENTVGSKPDGKTGVFIQQLFGLSDELMSQITSSFTFRAPLKVGYVGRSALGLSCGSVVDVAVDMPGSCFDDKDYLNHRYHAKRVLYLDGLRVALTGKMGAKTTREAQKGRTVKGKGKSKMGQVLRVAWDREVVDPRKPVLRLELVALPGVEFRVHVSLEQKRAAWLKKLAPDSANVRSYGQMTPLYNHSISEDLLVLWQAEEVALTAGRFPIFADVVLLLDIWARNHGLAGYDSGLVAARGSTGRNASNGPPATTEDSCGLDISFLAALVALVLRNDTQMQYSTQRMHVFRGAMQVLCGVDSKVCVSGRSCQEMGCFLGGRLVGDSVARTVGILDSADTGGSLTERLAWRVQGRCAVRVASDGTVYKRRGADVAGRAGSGQSSRLGDVACARIDVHAGCYRRNLHEKVKPRDALRFVVCMPGGR